MVFLFLKAKRKRKMFQAWEGRNNDPASHSTSNQSILVMKLLRGTRPAASEGGIERAVDSTRDAAKNPLLQLVKHELGFTHAEESTENTNSNRPLDATLQLCERILAGNFGAIPNVSNQILDAKRKLMKGGLSNEAVKFSSLIAKLGIDSANLNSLTTEEYRKLAKTVMVLQLLSPLLGQESLVPHRHKSMPTPTPTPPLQPKVPLIVRPPPNDFDKLQEETAVAKRQADRAKIRTYLFSLQGLDTDLLKWKHKDESLTAHENSDDEEITFKSSTLSQKLVAGKAGEKQHFEIDLDWNEIEQYLDGCLEWEKESNGESFKVCKSERMLMEEVRKCGTLFHYLSNKYGYFGDGVVDNKGEISNDGVCIVIHEEIRHYYRLLSQIDSLYSSKDSNSRISENNNNNNNNNNNMTLRRLCVWIKPILYRFMAITTLSIRSHYNTLVVNCCSNIMTRISPFENHGDPAIKILAKEMICASATKVLKSIRMWCEEGLIPPDDSDFFVSKNSASSAVVASSNKSPYQIWYDSYLIAPGAVFPPFVSSRLAQLIFVTGKTKAVHSLLDKYLNRDNINNANNSMDNNANNSMDNNNNNNNNNNNWTVPEETALLHSVTKTLEISSRALLPVLFKQYQLMQHLEVVRAYVFFGAGDFGHALAGTGKRSLQKAVSGLAMAQHSTLTGSLAQALALSSSPFFLESHSCGSISDHLSLYLSLDDPTALAYRCLSVRYTPVLQSGLNHPIEILLMTQFALNHYHKISCLLWRVRVAEWEIGQNWSANRVFSTKSHLNSIASPCHRVTFVMQSFVNMLKFYLIYTIVEPDWIKFTTDIQGSATLGEIINAHNKMLLSISTKMDATNSSATTKKDLYVDVLNSIDDLTSVMNTITHEADGNIIEISNMPDYQARLFDEIRKFANTLDNLCSVSPFDINAITGSVKAMVSEEPS